jgi:hypothetical protein
MADELKALSKDFDHQKIKVLRTNLNLYQTNISQASSEFLREVATQAKKQKSISVALVAIIKEPA